MRFFLPVIVLALSTVATPFLFGCACGPTGETETELAPLVVTPSTTTIEIPATILVRSGRPEIEVSIPDCAAEGLSGATLEVRDEAGEPLARTASGTCRVRTTVSAPASSHVELRVVVTVPADTTATAEVELVTFQDVCASVGASEIVAFGT